MDHPTHFAENGPARISYGVSGRGPAICLLPSTGRGAEDFAHLAAALLGHGYSVILPQPRGIGGSTGPLAGLTLHDLAADAAAVLRTATGGAETERVIVGGHAYGNWIARTLAADHPELVRGVALIAAGAGPRIDGLTQALDTLGDPGAGPEAKRAALEFAFFAPGHDVTGWLTGWHGEVIAAQRAANQATERSRWWGAGQAPLLDLMAAKDPFRQPVSRDLFEREFGARVTTRLIEDASHALPDEQPEQVAAAIATWGKTLAP